MTLSVDRVSIKCQLRVSIGGIDQHLTTDAFRTHDLENWPFLHLELTGYGKFRPKINGMYNNKFSLMGPLKCT